MSDRCLVLKLVRNFVNAIALVAFITAGGVLSSLAQDYRLQRKIHVLGTFSVDGDMLEMLRTSRKGKPGRVQIKLSSDGTWWKMLRMFDKAGASTNATLVATRRPEQVSSVGTVRLQNAPIADTIAVLLGVWSFL